MSLLSSKPSQVVLKYKEILKNNGISDKVSEVIVKGSGMKGEGMASETSYVTIEFENNRKPLNLFVKTHTSNPVHTELVENAKLFKKEAAFFMEYIPAAERFCKIKGQETLLENMYPKCYFGDETMMVFENLVLDKGYILLDKEAQQGMDAVRLAIPTLAKHHAISYAMIKECGDESKFFKKFPTLDFESFTQDVFRKMMEPMINNGVLTNIKALEQNTQINGAAEAAEWLSEYKDKAFNYMMDMINHEPDEFLVLGHGDFWNNNMMFGKDANGQLVEHVAIDLQVTRYNSPALDLCYYLYTSVRGDVRRAQLHEILDLYLTTLKTTANSLGHPINLSAEELFLMYRKKFKFGFWVSVCVTIGAAFTAMKEIDIDTLGDLGDFSKQFTAFIDNWIEQNPDKGEECARVMIKLSEEYKDLELE